MGGTLNVTKKEKVRNNEITWYMTENANYGVEVIILGTPSNPSPRTLKKWQFGSDALAETVSYYWFEKMISLMKNYYEYPEEITRIVYKSEPEDIEKMCKKAVGLCFDSL